MLQWTFVLRSVAQVQFQMPDLSSYSGPACVSVTVDLHVDFLVEPFATVRADEGFEVRVSAHVRVQVGRPVEGLLADGTHIGFDGGVGEAVTGQVARLAEGPATHLTFERLLPRVDALQTDKQQV